MPWQQAATSWCGGGGGASASMESRSPRGWQRRVGWDAKDTAQSGGEGLEGGAVAADDWQDGGRQWGGTGSAWWQRDDGAREEKVPQPWYIDQHDMVLEPSNSSDHRYTIVVLHSCSGGPDDFLGFFHRLGTPLRRHIRVVIPCAPVRRESSYGWSKEQNSWFEYADDSDDGNGLKFPEQLVEQRRRILTLLENERRRFPDLDARRILLWGLSQGVGLAIDVALHATFHLAGVLALRGMALREGLPDPAVSAARRMSFPVRVLAINGDWDRHCPPAAARATYEALREHGVQVDIVVEPSLGHACARGRQQMNAAELRRINAFVGTIWEGL
mmetsp:Transcript_120182/g.347295  ORF Transcript_120182/g.347295 Transcript_120182/m.347295 type:complete len:330 (-) Transcript_120182:128-1117(-)